MPELALSPAPLVAAHRGTDDHGPPKAERNSLVKRYPLLALLVVMLLGQTWSLHWAAAQTPTRRPPRVESLDAPPSLTAMERVDRVFARAVDEIATVLFYRLFAEDRQFVQMAYYEDYVRPANSPEATLFQRLVASAGPVVPDEPVDPLVNARLKQLGLADTLSVLEVEALHTRGLLELGPRNNAIRHGRLQDEEVEFIRVIVDDSTKFVLVIEPEYPRGIFRMELPKRGLISLAAEDSRTWDQIELLGQLGRLKEDPVLAADPQRPYLLVEQIGGAPVVVLWLGAGSIFFTFYMRWYNLWGFRHAIEIVRGRYDNPNEPGEVSHFQALASALSATVGLGNIAGVTVAMTLGGPGAFFWMMACGLFGMSSKFVECTLGQKYRRVKPDGTVLGGPMQYLREGLAELGLRRLGLVLSVVFSVMCILASFGGGNMFQANQSGSAMVAMLQQSDIAAMEQLNLRLREAAESQQYDRMKGLQAEQKQLSEQMESFRRQFLPIFGVVMAGAVAFVIIGGIKRIGAAAGKLVPLMCLIYLSACMWIILRHLPEVPGLFASIFTEAFTGKAMGAGVLGVMVLGIQRAAFSNEAGVGSAAIAHSAAKTDEPVREGTVALMGPFIDTVVVCSMTALVILITGAWDYDPWVVEQRLEGSALTSVAFAQEISWFPYVLAVAILLFAFSTIISWSYYGERCWEYLFGAERTYAYRIIYVLCVLIGSVVNLGAVLDFSDMMILSMAFPNVLGVVLLSPKVRRDLVDYWRRYKAGEFKRYK